MKRLATCLAPTLALVLICQAKAQDAAAPPLVVPAVTPAYPGIAPAGVATAPVCDMGSGCDQCEHHGWLYAGVGLEWLQPSWHNNPAFTTASITTTPTPTVNVGNTSFTEHMEASPAAWIGASSASGLGFQVDFWRFNESSFASGNPNGSDILFSAGPLLGIGAFAINPTTTLATSSGLSFDVWDFDATYRATFNQWWLLIGAGIRYAHIAQNFGAFTATPDDPASNQALIASHNFNGAGPDLMAESHWSLGSFGLGFYVKAHAGLLFGTSNERVDWQNILGLNGGIGGIIGIANAVDPNLHAQNTETDNIPYATIEMGGEYAYQFGQRSEIFAQCGLAAQEWFGAGNSNNMQGQAIRAGARSDLGLVGLAASLGVRY